MDGGIAGRGRVAAVIAVALVVASFVLTGAPSHAATVRATTPSRPNIVLILTDDQRWDSLAELPATNGLAWRRYTRSFVIDRCCRPRSVDRTHAEPTGDSLARGGRLDERRRSPRCTAGYRAVLRAST
jgi:hypothetical protein